MHLNAVILSNLLLICLINVFCLYSAYSCVKLFALNSLELKSVFFWTPTLDLFFAPLSLSVCLSIVSLCQIIEREFELKYTFIVWAYLPASLIKYIIDDSRKEGALY